MKWKLDYGDKAARVVLACCACGWRGLATSKDAAMERLRSHEVGQHPKDLHVRTAMRVRESRARKNTGM